MSPSKQIVDPLGQSAEAFEYGSEFIYVQFDPAASGVILSGNVVKISAVLASTTAQMLCELTSVTGDFTFLGVAVDAPAGGYLPGAVVKIQTAGVCTVLFDDDNDTVYGDLAIQSAGVVGQATVDAAGQLAKTLGIVLETLTVIAAGTPCLVYLRIM